MESPRPDWSESREPWQRAQDYDDDLEFGPELPFWKPVIIATIVTVFVFGMLGWFFCPKPARAHDAIPTASEPLGWRYGYECCHSLDCSRVETSSEIGETPDGYLVRRTGEVIAYSDKRIKRSRDEYYHRCTPSGNPDAPRSICLYVPDRGF